MNTPQRILGALLLAGLLLAGPALAAKLDKEPGYIDLEWIEIPEDADEIKDIDLSPMLLSIARDAEAEGDKALMKALSMVRSIRVRAFSVEPEMTAEVSRTVDRVLAKLKDDDWQRLIYVKDKDETISVSTRYDADDKLVGLMLVAYEPGDSAAFVNVVGDLDLVTLMRLAGEIDSDNLEEMLEELDGVGGLEVERDRDGD